METKKKQQNLYALYDAYGKYTEVVYCASNKQEAERQYRKDKEAYNQYGEYAELKRWYATGGR